MEPKSTRQVIPPPAIAIYLMLAIFTISLSYPLFTTFA